MQKLQENCKSSLKLRHTDTSTLKKGRGQYGKGKGIGGDENGTNCKESCRDIQI